MKLPKLPFGLAVLLLWQATACHASPAPADFSDPLSGPVSPSFQIPFEAYSLTPDGLLRSHSDSGAENGVDRPVVKTISGDYQSRDFVFEVDVTIPADHGDIAFVGFGLGRNYPDKENEPNHAFLFRIHNLPRLPYFSIDAAVADPRAGLPAGDSRQLVKIAEYTSGRPMRFRISHQAGTVTLAVPAVAGAEATFDMARYRDLFDNGEAFLFLSNSSKGTTFRNASLLAP